MSPPRRGGRPWWRADDAVATSRPRAPAAPLYSFLKGARDRKSAAPGRRVEGRKGYRETNPGLVREAERLARRNPKTGETRSLREIADQLAGLGHATAAGKPFSASQVQRLLRG